MSNCLSEEAPEVGRPRIRLDVVGSPRSSAPRRVFRISWVAWIGLIGCASPSAAAESPTPPAQGARAPASTRSTIAETRKSTEAASPSTGASSRSRVADPATETPSTAKRPLRPSSATVRAIWVTRWDFRTRADVENIVEQARVLGFNRLYFQVRGRADALYRSNIEPWAEELGPHAPDFDPLEVAVRAARRQGIELHAWVNVLAAWKGKDLPKDPSHVARRRPAWFLQDRRGERRILGEHYSILNPCEPEVREHIARVIADIATRYAIDGVHFDYLRFVAESAVERQAVPYDNRTLARFRAENDGDFPIRRPERWNEFRRTAINDVVRAAAGAVRRARPRALVSAAVIRDFDLARERYFQDAPRWIEAAWIDELVSMNYERSVADFDRHLQRACETAGASKVVCGIGAYLLDGNPASIAAQIRAARAAGTRGYAIFAWANLYATPSPASISGAAADRHRAALRRTILELHGVVPSVADSPPGRRVRRIEPERAGAAAP
jgi:uncharacterized lipoprotein YddW (UPF0748 family)